MRLRHEATYQGYPGKAVLFRRGPGLNPEAGWIDLDMGDVKKLLILPREIPWRAVNGFEIPGAVDIKTWYGLTKDQTVTGLKDLPTPSGGGFNAFGNLVLTSYNSVSGTRVDQIVYNDIYIGSGLEEITRDLANVEDHSEGTIRVPLTDVRKWYRYSALICKINRRLKSGNWDETSLNDGAPWGLKTVLQFLCSQLPGSPTVASYSEVNDTDFDPPTDLVGEGEPAVEHLQKVLDHYGLQAAVLPTNNILIYKKYSRKFGYKEVGGDNGNTASVPAGGSGLHYERKTVGTTDRAPAVVVIGKRRVKRGTFPYVPVLQYVDGRYYPLQTVLDFMGYAKSSLDAGLFNNTHSRFKDVPPQPGDGNDGRLHEKHRAILAMAYRVYAPAFLFPESGGTGSAMPDAAARLSAYLPIVDCPYYVRELGNADLKIPTHDRGKGDQDDFVLLPPVARGNRRGTQFFTDFGALEDYFNGKISSQQSMVADLQAQVQVLRDKLQAIGDSLSSVDEFAESTFRTQDVQEKWKAKNAAKFVRLNQDAVNAAKAVGFGKVFDKEFVENQMFGFGIMASIEIFNLSRSISSLNKMIDEHGSVISDWQEKFQAFKTVYSKRGGVPVIFNAPYDELEKGTFKVDPQTGILTSSQPLCQVDKPFFFDGDSVRVVADGAVTVTWGYELKDNNIGGYTAFLFTPDGADLAPANAVFAGVCRSSPIKALGVPMNARMYLLDLGTPVNFNACYSEAYGKAAPLLGLPAAFEGFTYEVDGFRNYWLDAGVSSVQHSWDGEREAAYTFVAMNSPGARLPAGPPMVPTVDRRAVRAERAEAIERERTE